MTNHGNPATLAAEAREAMARDIDRARLTAMREHGMRDHYSDEQMLAMAPRVDPRDPAGKAALEAFVRGNPGLFAGSQAQQVEALRARVTATAASRGSKLFDPERLINATMKRVKR